MNSKPKTAPDGAVKKKKQRSPLVKFIFTVTKILTVFFVALACAIVGILGGAVYGYIKTAAPITPEQLQLKKFTSFVYDSKSNEIAQLKGSENRVWVDDKEIPKYLKDAFVAIEDERFYEHPGVDLKRMVGAGVNLINPYSKGIYGGSTITQQVIKNLTGNTKQSLQRKVQEQWQAIQLEKKLEKWQILELYMNLIFMGENCYGVQSAAKTYFNKDVRTLSLAACASLAGITNLPGRYNPLTTEGRKRNKERQEIILAKMLELNFINQQEYDQAMKEGLNFVHGDASELRRTSKQSYFVDQVVIDVKKDLMNQLGLSEQMATATIYNKGIKIYTTMDSGMQKEMDAVYKDDKYFPIVNKNQEHPQSAMVILDSKTAQVRALYGGYGEKTADMILNRASSSLMKRQAGSSFKPIAVYGPAINEKIITPATIVDDVPVYMDTFHKDQRYPTNFESGVYRGLTNIHDAIAYSQNVVAAKVWKDLLGPDLSLSYLKKVGINRDNERYVSLALGGLNEGVNPLTMASAYVPFGNKGVYYEPSTYTKVEDMDGKILLEKKPKSTIVYDEAAAYVATSMLKGPVIYGTAVPYGTIKNAKGEIIPTAGKTGTTSDFIDKWFVGFSPYYVAATWYGYDNNSKNKKPISLQKPEQDQALKIWNAVMNKVHKDAPVVDFQEPAGIVRKTICIYSGKAPTELCAQDPRNANIASVRYDEVFIKGTEPKDGEVCDVHVKGQVCKDSKDIWGRNLLFGPNCPPESMIEKVFIQRKAPYTPVKQDDPYPADWAYELPAAEYCNVHGGPVTEQSDSNLGVAGNNNNNAAKQAGDAAGIDSNH